MSTCGHKFRVDIPDFIKNSPHVLFLCDRCMKERCKKYEKKVKQWEQNLSMKRQGDNKNYIDPEERKKIKEAQITYNYAYNFSLHRKERQIAEDV